MAHYGKKGLKHPSSMLRSLRCYKSNQLYYTKIVGKSYFRHKNLKPYTLCVKADFPPHYPPMSQKRIPVKI